MREVSKSPEVDLVIPARDDECTIGSVIANVPSRAVRSVVVVDNGSRDRTVQVAEDAGAIVIREPFQGYGAACLRGVIHLSTLPKPPDIVVFCAADGSSNPANIPALIHPLKEGFFDLVIGSRALAGGRIATKIRARNLVAVELIHAIYGHRYTDLGPFRAIRYPALIALGMRDTGYGWLVEMQVKALKVGLRIAEEPVDPPGSLGRPQSVREQIRTTIEASTKSIFQIFRHSTAR